MRSRKQIRGLSPRRTQRRLLRGGDPLRAPVRAGPFGGGTATEVLYPDRPPDAPAPLEGDLGACVPEVQAIVSRALARTGRRGRRRRRAAGRRPRGRLGRPPARSGYRGPRHAGDGERIPETATRRARVEESLQRLREVAEKNPASLEAAARAARGKPRDDPPATSSRVRRGRIPGAGRQPIKPRARPPTAVSRPGSSPPCSCPPWDGRAAAGGPADLLRVAGALLALAMAAGVVLLARRPPASAPPRRRLPAAAARQAPAVVPRPYRRPRRRRWIRRRPRKRFRDRKAAWRSSPPIQWTSCGTASWSGRAQHRCGCPSAGR
jgi:hypothetical protein